MATEPPLLQPRVQTGLTELVAAFERHGVQYALIGGLAVGLRSRPRSTRDIDLLVAIPQIKLPTLLADLAAHGFTIDETAVITGYVQQHMAAFEFHGVRVDWLKPLVPLYQHVLDTAGPSEGFGRPTRVASAEGLILLKLLADRPRDLADIDEMLAANKGNLALEWIEREWDTVSSTEDPRWRKFREAVAEYSEF